MSFDVPAESYARFMGRFSEPLALELLDAVNVVPGQRVLDVGCGPGALTAPLVERFGPAAVCAIEPSVPFVAAATTRFPEVDIRQASAERIPFDDATFDVTLAQLVVHFMSDPVAGLREMRRVTRPGGTIAASVWDFAGDRAPLSVFWQAARALDPSVVDETGLAGAREGHLVDLFAAAGISDVREHVLTVRVRYAAVDEWWEPYTYGVGPSGAYAAALDDQQRARLKQHAATLLPAGPFDIEASAWLAVGRA
jgi:SAM-dependent methyltransferase